MKVRSVLALFVCLTAVAGTHALVQPPEGDRDPRWIELPRLTHPVEKLDPQEGSAEASKVREFLARHGGQWEFAVDRRTGRPALAQGSGLPVLPGIGNGLDVRRLDTMTDADGRITARSLEPAGRSFLETHRALLMPTEGSLELDQSGSYVRDDARLAGLYFRWIVGGVPVESARVFLRLNSGNLTQFGSVHIGEIDVDPVPTLDRAQAVARMIAYSGDDEAYRLEGEPRLLIQPEDDGDRIAYRLVWKVTYRVPQSVGLWEARVDAHTGEIVAFRDINHYARVVGGVYPRTIFDGDETVVPFPQVDVNNDGTTITTDTSGAYVYAGGVASTALSGPIFDTSCQGCTNPGQPTTSVVLGTGRLDLGTGGADEVGNGVSTPADRNAVYHLTQVRRLVRKWQPGYAWTDSTLTVNVNIQDTCNATYGGNTLNFFRSGGGCNNTGEVSDVMHHEYGHGVDLNSRGADGASGEATADVVAIHMSHSPLIGPGFRVGGDPVRNIDSATSSRGVLSTGNVGSVCPVIGSLGPLGYEVHCEGEIYGQAAWDLSQLLVGRYGHHTGWRESERLFFSSLFDAGSYLSTGSFPIYDAYIQADDDNGNLADGTPHADEIFQAFDDHGIAGTQRPASPDCVRPAQPAVTVMPSCDSLEITWTDVPGIDHYEILRTELRGDTAFFPVANAATGETSHVDAEVAPGLDYTYVVMAVDANGCESTTENPVAGRLDTQPVLSLVAAVDDDTPRGNRSGFADPGEEVDLKLTLTNFGEVDGASVAGTLTSTTPGVTVLDSFSTWPVVTVGGIEDNQATLRFMTDDLVVQCGETLDFRFVPEEATACADDTSYFEVTVGERIVDLRDDFEVDSGWTLDVALTTATTGAWVRGDPQPTAFQPGDDVSDVGTDCFYTADNTGAGTDDIDDGTVVLVSPMFDLSGLTDTTLSYFRWFANSEPGTDSGDFFRADISDDGGASWVNLETLDFTQNAPAWTERKFRVSDFVALTDQVQIRFSAADGPVDGAVVEAAVDEVTFSHFECDPTPACFVEPNFVGVQSVTPGTSCAETALDWQPAQSNCLNAELTYNVYRSTDPAFVPGPASLVAAGVSGTSFQDSLLQPGADYTYVVRANDSRSGEDSNLATIQVVAPVGPDLAAPLFAGLQLAASGADCGEVDLTWAGAQETCSDVVYFEIYRSTDPAFVPGPANRIGSTFDTSFTDATVTPGQSVTYVVRARDDTGNEDANDVRFTVDAGITDLELAATRFEPNDAGWSVVAPNDAVTGNWEWGDPEGTGEQPEDDRTEAGSNAWITGLSAAGPGGNNDIDDGTTTLLTQDYDMAGAVDPAVRYSRWFTNDLGAAPNEDPFVVEISNNNGADWVEIERLLTGVPLGWIDVEIPLAGLVAPTATMRLRFTASDLVTGSLVEAGIDDFSLVDRAQGCTVCVAPVTPIGNILVDRSGDDVVVDWTADPAAGTRFAIYRLTGPTFSNQVRVGTVLGRTFIHTGAALAGESFNYRVTAIDSCGNESILE